MESNFVIQEGHVELLGEVKELWQKLNSHHLNGTDYFKEKFQNNTFEKRMKSLTEKALEGDIQVLVIKDTDKDCKIGYCVSTFNADGTGEIDSLYVEQEYRKLHLGDELMKAALKWLESKEPKEIILSVAGGNEKVLDFYKKYGFQTAAVKMTKVQGQQDGFTAYKDYKISAEKSMLKLGDIVRLLGASYWASQRSKEKIIRSIENSLCFGVYHENKQIAFARMITDYATFAYLCDVIVDEDYRGAGIGKALMDYIMEYPKLQNIRTLCLMTNDAHKLYEKYGFSNMDDPSRFMWNRRKDIF